MPWIRCLANNRNVLLVVLQAGKSKIKAQADSVFVRTLFLIHRWFSFCCFFIWYKGLRIFLEFLL